MIYILGLLILSFGIALSIRTGLGVAPVSSIPYTLSKITGVSVGLTTTAFYWFCVLLQLFILKKDFKVRHLLQLIFAYAFGLFTDMSLFFTRNLVIDLYPVRLLFLALSLILIAFGVFTVVLTDVVLNAPDGLVKTISERWNIKFSRVKSTFDILCVVTSVILSLSFTGGISGLREGTIISALSIGGLIGFFSKRYRENVIALFT
jgi:uncharacterized membrane protein YczE